MRITKPLSRLKSIQALFLAAMALLIIILSVPLLWSGVTIITTLTHQYGGEIITEKLHSLIDPINRRYDTLARVGLEDSASHRQEILDNALLDLAGYRYKESGSVFVVSTDATLILSADFQGADSPDFPPFFANLQGDFSTFKYKVAGKARIGVATYYPPWDSYIGLSLDKNELLAPKNRFIRITLLVLAIVVIIASLFGLAIHYLLILPILRLTHFADQVTNAQHGNEIPGHFILELATLKKDIMHMVATLVSREERYRAVFNAPGDAIFIHEAATARIIEVNKAVQTLYGYDQTEALKLNVEDLSSGVSPYTRAEAEKRIAMVPQAGPQRFEWHARRKTGELFWVDVDLQSFGYGDDLCVLAVVRDIEARKKAALDLAAEKEQLAITLRSIGDGVITTDQQGKVILLNKVAEDLTGWSQSEAAGRPLPEIFQLINSRNNEPCPDPAQEVLKGGRQLELAKHTTLVARNGTRRAISDSTAPIHNPDGELVGVVLVFRDVTEKLRTEQELHKIKKLESISVLAGGIAHDFNNLLTAILGNINLARLSAEGGSQLDNLLEQAEKASLRAQNLTRQLLTFARGGEPVRQHTDLAEIIQDNAAFTLRGSAISYQFEPPHDLWPVDIDPGQIGQVIQNIILNARQAMEPGVGHIEITAKNCQFCHEITVPAESCVQVSIRDTGPGIPTEVIDSIFDPYFSTKELGSGLGLAISHSIIKKHDGVLLVSSTEGQGTVFTLKLPVSQGTKAPSLPRQEHKKAQTPLKVLVMDDEEMLCKLAVQIFSILGHRVQTVVDGEQALASYQEARAQGEPFDVVIMDLTIPGGMGGKEAVTKILEVDSAAKVIVASGYSNDPVMADYKRYGFVGMLGKPYRLSDLEKVLADIL